MDQIIPYPLWVGHAGDGRDYRSILDGGIRALLQVAVEEQALQPPSELIYLRFPILDGIDNPPDVLSLAVSTAAALIQAHVPTLVCCGAGMSRAPLMAAAGMAVAHGEPLEACLQHVAQHHPCDVSPGLWSEVRATLTSMQQG
jgi:protein-tyrosine phosphatase